MQKGLMMVECGCFYCESCYLDSCKYRLEVLADIIPLRQFKLEGAVVHSVSEGNGEVF